MLDITFKKQLSDLISQFIQDGGHTKTVIWNLSKIIEDLSPCGEDYQTDEEEEA